MARDYGRVRVLFWESETIKPLSTDAKCVGLYLLTSPHTNAIGCFRLPMAYVADDTGMSQKSLENGFAALRAAGFMEWCERHPWVWIPNYLKHNPPENPNVWRKCVKELEALPAVSAQAHIADELAEIGREDRMRNPNSKTRVSDEEIDRLKRFAYRSDTVSEGQRPLPCPIPYPEPIYDVSSTSRTTASRAVPARLQKSLNGHAKEFDAFWAAYPRREAKRAAIRAYLKALSRAGPDVILAGAQRYALSRKDEDSQFTKMPATWLNADCWLDEAAATDGSPAPDLKRLQEIEAAFRKERGYE